MTFLSIDILDEIFRFTDKPSFVLYFKSVLCRQTIHLLYRYLSIDEQAKKGNLQTVNYLHLVRFTCTTDAIEFANTCGYLEAVNYLVKYHVKK